MENTQNHSHDRISNERRKILAAYGRCNPATGHTFANTVQKNSLANLVKRWLETRTTSFIDEAICYCQRENIEVLPELRKHLADAAEHRLKGQPSKAVKEGVKGKAFIVMVNLISVGATLREASGKAAKWTKINSPFAFKASTLEKLYEQEFRSGEETLESYYLRNLKNVSTPEIDREWERLREVLEEPTEVERGERR